MDILKLKEMISQAFLKRDIKKLRRLYNFAWDMWNESRHTFCKNYKRNEIDAIKQEKQEYLDITFDIQKLIREIKRQQLKKPQVRIK